MTAHAGDGADRQTQKELGGEHLVQAGRPFDVA